MVEESLIEAGCKVGVVNPVNQFQNTGLPHQPAVFS